MGMKILVAAACLALVALCVSASPVGQEGQTDAKEPVKRNLKSCAKDVLEEWVTLPVPLDLEFRTQVGQVHSCHKWYPHLNRHLKKFHDCYYKRDNEYRFGKLHKKIRKTISMSPSKEKLYERRIETYKFCRNLYKKVEVAIGRSGWENMQEEAPISVDETLGVKTCAQSHLKAMESFKLPETFRVWARDPKANFCEEAQKKSLELTSRECNSKFRLSDYLVAYSEGEKKIYNDTRDGAIACEPFVGPKFDWSNAEKPVLDLETCERDILDDFLSIPAPLDLKYKHLTPIGQAWECSSWYGYLNDHLNKFQDCYKLGGGYKQMHKSIRKTHLSQAQLKLHARRMKYDKFCDELHDKSKELIGTTDWTKLPEEPARPLNEALDVKTCARSHLDDMVGFKLPAGFERRSIDSKANFCEEAREKSHEMCIEDCFLKFRMFDYRQVYSEEEERIYDETKKGAIACEPFLGTQFDWLAAEAPLEENNEEENGDEDVED